MDALERLSRCSEMAIFWSNRSLSDTWSLPMSSSRMLIVDLGCERIRRSNCIARCGTLNL